MSELRYAIRGLRKNPGLSAAAILSLALGIGANTSIFSVTSALLLHPLPYADPDRLVLLWNRSPGLNIAEDWFSTAQYFDIKSSHTGFEELAIALGSNSTSPATASRRASASSACRRTCCRCWGRARRLRPAVRARRRRARAARDRGAQPRSVDRRAMAATPAWSAARITLNGQRYRDRRRPAGRRSGCRGR